VTLLSSQNKLVDKYMVPGGGAAAATQHFSRDRVLEELQGDASVEPHPKVWTKDQRKKYCLAKNSVPKRLRCRTFMEEVCQIMQLMTAR